MGVRGIAAALHRPFREIIPQERDRRNQHLFHEPAEVPIKERTVQRHAFHVRVGVMLHVIGDNQSTRRMPHEDDIAMSFFLYNMERGVDVGEIFRQALAIEGVLVRKQRSPVFAEVEGIEIVAMLLYAIAQLRLEEIIIVAMDIKDRLLASFQGRTADERANHASFVIFAHLDSTLLICAAQDVVYILCLQGEYAEPREKAQEIESFHTHCALFL